MVDNSPPSRSFANDDTLTGTFKEVLKKFLQSTDDMIPAKIVEYDRAANRAKVKPLIQVLTTDGRRVPRDPIASVPVILLGGGGFFLTFHLPPGSLGFIKACDRDISLFLQSYEDNPPNTTRLHDFSDSLFIPDVMKGHTIDPEDDQAMVIQNLDGSVKISINDARIKMAAPQIELVTGASSLTMTDGNIDIVGADITSDSDITSDGTITGTTDVIGGGISVLNHTHAQGNDSDGNVEVDTDPPS